MTIYESLIQKHPIVEKKKQEEIANIYEEKELRKMAVSESSVIKEFIIDIIRERRKIAQIKDQEILFHMMADVKEACIIRGAAVKTYFDLIWPPLEPIR